MAAPLSILCIASYHKGQEFLREAKRQGARVYLVTSESLRDADWPRESLDDIFFVKDDAKRWKLDDLILGASHLARHVPIDRIVPLDDFDLEKASALREHLRVPGMGETTTRYFRDKLAMRLRADEAGVPRAAVRARAERSAGCAPSAPRVPPPWVLKPRLEAGTIGIKKVQHEAELWPLVDDAGRSGVVPPARAVRAGRRLPRGQRGLRARGAGGGGQPLRPPALRRVARRRRVHDAAGRARRRRRPRAADRQSRGADRARAWCAACRTPSSSRAPTASWYFLETSARVGGAHIVELVEAATGMNLWAEWAKVELAGGKAPYARAAAARATTPAWSPRWPRQEWPDLSEFGDPEVVWRLSKRHHAGLIVASPGPRARGRAGRALRPHARRALQHLPAAGRRRRAD